MILSKTPYRISFFGGGTDYPSWYKKFGGSVLSSTINKYLYITCRRRPEFFKSKYRISYSKIEEVKSLSQIKHKVVRKILQYYRINEGLEIHYDGDLPSKSGMGSSSSFTVGLLNLLSNLKDVKISKRKLAKQSIFFEQNILKETVGSQDQVAASYGGFNKINFLKNGNFSVNKLFKNKHTAKNLNKNLILVHSGIHRMAENIAKTFVNKIKYKDRLMNEINDLVNEGINLLEKDQYDEFGILLGESWKLKKSLSTQITNEKINEMYNIALAKGALGGKILGAGGGGFLLLYVPENKKIRVMNLFKKNIIVPFKFDNIGSSIVPISNEKIF
jgi:D-glycero-alpha-D-manno-heptose-7-phosphate kinase